MRITVVFEFPDDKSPEIVMSEHWKGGRLIAYHRSDALAELDRLRAAARHYCLFLHDEINDPSLCIDDDHRAAVEALWAAVVGA